MKFILPLLLCLLAFSTHAQKRKKSFAYSYKISAEDKMDYCIYTPCQIFLKPLMGDSVLIVGELDSLELTGAVELTEPGRHSITELSNGTFSLKTTAKAIRTGGVDVTFNIENFQVSSYVVRSDNIGKSFYVSLQSTSIFDDPETSHIIIESVRPLLEAEITSLVRCLSTQHNSVHSCAPKDEIRFIIPL